MKPNYYVVSFSGGKDSTAMLLHLLELGRHIDEVVFCDTGKEFPAMYKHIERVKEKIEAYGVQFTTLASEKSFDFLMFEYRPKHRNPEAFIAKYGDVSGYGWPYFNSRWCTGYLKRDVVNAYFKELKKEFNIIQYVGIAADETERLERKIAQQGRTYPLVEWGWSEADCLQYCYALGYDWDGLYNHFDRVSCWCCPLKKLDELRVLRKYYPDLWAELIQMEHKSYKTFRLDCSVDDLERRFAFEEQRLKEGKSIRNREFFAELKELLKGEENGRDTTQA